MTTATVSIDTSTVVTNTTVTLSNGVEMPVVALGTAPLMTSDEDSSHFHPLNSFNGFLPEQACRSVHAALEMNVHKHYGNGDDDGDASASAPQPLSSIPVHIDTALVYRTHPHIRQVMGNALATGRKKRSDVFLTTKIFHPCYSFGPEDLGHCMPSDPECEAMSYDDVYKFVYRQFQQSLHECGVGYFDLVLLHWPGRQREHLKTKSATVLNVNGQHRLAAWHLLEDCYAKGWTRAIGVSNFSEDHLEELQAVNEASKIATTVTKNERVAVKPHVNQIEASVFLQHKGILDYCLANGIVPVAYSPLGRGVTHVTSDKTVQKIAAKHGKDVGQVAMKYLLQKGYGCVVFWTTNVGRIQSNHQVHDFELEQDEIEALDGLNRSDGSGTWGLLSPYEIP
jgi:diketogulonate reductase-like aldo/keto reductase